MKEASGLCLRGCCVLSLSLPHRVIAISAMLMVIPLRATANDQSTRFKKALLLLQKQDLDGGEVILKALLNESPQHPVYLFNLGNISYLRGDLAEAIAYYRAVQQQRSPLAIPSALYLSSCFRELGLLRESLLALQSIDQQRLPAQLLNEWRERRKLLRSSALQVMSSHQQRKEWSLALDALAIVRALGDSADLQSLRLEFLRRQARREEDALPSQRLGLEERTQQTVSRGQWGGLAALECGYLSNLFADSQDDEQPSSLCNAWNRVQFAPSPQASYPLQLYSDLSWSEASRTSDYRYVELGLGLVQSRDIEGVHVSWQPEVLMNAIEKGPFWWRWGGSLRAEWWREPGWTLGVRYRGLSNQVLEPLYADLQGSSHSLQVYASNFSGPWLVLPYGLLEYEQQRDRSVDNVRLPRSYRGYGCGFSLIRQLPARWKMRSDASILQRDYIRMALPDRVPRRDQNLSVAVRLTWNWNQRTALYQSTTWRWNLSNLGSTSAIADKNYRQLLVLLGLEREW
jgi:hypothetical protein